MGPTSKVMKQAGFEDGLAGARVVGNTDTYLEGYAEGEHLRPVVQKYDTLTNERLTKIAEDYGLETGDRQDTLLAIVRHLMKGR